MLTLYFYLSIISLALVLSDRPVWIRAIGGGIWCLLSVVLVGRTLLSLVERRRAAQGWQWHRDHRCAACGFEVDLGMTQCPECGKPARAPPS